MVLLSADKIGRRKATSEEWLFRDISLSVSDGQRIGLAGPTGAGKTVLLRSLAFLDPLDEGTISWKGKPVDGADVPLFRRNAIYVHQQPSLIGGSVEVNLRAPFLLKSHKDKTFDADFVHTLLHKVGRDESFLLKNDVDLSGGERQLVCLIRCLQLRPALLMLDEPTSALDSETALCVETLVDFWFSSKSDGESRAVIWVSHSETQLSRVADSVVRIVGGRVVSAGVELPDSQTASDRQ